MRVREAMLKDPPRSVKHGTFAPAQPALRAKAVAGIIGNRRDFLSQLSNPRPLAPRLEQSRRRPETLA
jgi:hypothetical protein